MPKAPGRVLSSEAFISLGVLRHLQGTPALREQIQQLRHLDANAVERPPLARSTWSGALASKERIGVLRFFKHCFLKTASPVLYERDLRPMLMACL